MSGIGIITNPHSKLNKRNPRRQALLGYILGEQGQLEVTNTLADLERVAREFRDRKIHTLAINGGDGTISRTLTAFHHCYGQEPLPRIALLRGGTINVLANNLGIKGSPEQVLYRLIEAYSAGNGLPTLRLNSLVIENNVGFLFGNGVAARFLKEYYKNKSGPVGAFILVLRVWLSRWFDRAFYNEILRDEKVTLTLSNGQVIEQTSCGVFCSTVKKMPLGVPLFHELGKPKYEGPHFETLSFLFKAEDAVWQLPRVMVKMQDVSITEKKTFCTDRLTIAMDEPFDFTLDGELFVTSGNQLEIRMGPSFEFVVI